MNLEERRKYNREYSQRRRDRIVSYLGGVCVICGTTEELEIDHKDRGSKSMSISHCINSNFDRVKEEIDKCQLLCRKHHREKTASENEGFTHGTTYAWMKKKCRCEACKPLWRSFHDKRNEARRKETGRGPYSKNPNHGTTAKYSRGCRCESCRAANAAKAKRLRSN